MVKLLIGLVILVVILAIALILSWLGDWMRYEEEHFDRRRKALAERQRENEKLPF